MPSIPSCRVASPRRPRRSRRWRSWSKRGVGSCASCGIAGRPSPCRVHRSAPPSRRHPDRLRANGAISRSVARRQTAGWGSRSLGSQPGRRAGLGRPRNTPLRGAREVPSFGPVDLRFRFGNPQETRFRGGPPQPHPPVRGVTFSPRVDHQVRPGKARDMLIFSFRLSDQRRRAGWGGGWVPRNRVFCGSPKPTTSVPWLAGCAPRALRRSVFRGAHPPPRPARWLVRNPSVRAARRRLCRRVESASCPSRPSRS